MTDLPDQVGPVVGICLQDWLSWSDPQVYLWDGENFIGWQFVRGENESDDHGFLAYLLPSPRYWHAIPLMPAIPDSPDRQRALEIKQHNATVLDQIEQLRRTLR